MTTVTLHIYSGRPNPRWTLTSDQEKVLTLIQAIGKTEDNLTALRPPPRLGYRGFTLSHPGLNKPAQKLFLHDDRLVGGLGGARRFSGHILERLLLETAGTAVSDAARTAVLARLNQLEVEPAAKPTALGAPPYEPGVWNDDPDIMENNNCYNYANNLITDTFAQPGRGSGQVYTDDDCTNVGEAAERDGQVPYDAPDQDPDDGQIICLVIWPDEDFHWYRKDSNGQWSHKPGETEATNLDASDEVIDDPETCDRGEYTIVCGYYLCDPDVVHID